jgi:spermidine/putrescine transport system permease protein
MKKNSVLDRVFIVLVFLFLYAPIFVLIVFSFNASKSRTVWAGFTLDWYVQLFHNKSIMDALSTTLSVSVIAASVATVVGTAAAIGFYSMRRRPRNILMGVNSIPMINADIITGVSLMLLFVISGTAITVAVQLVNNLLGTNMNFQFSLGFGTLLLAHITFDIPYVILSVMPKLRQMDKNAFEAAQDLGATTWQAFWKVVLPEIRPGVVNGLIIAFTMSIDDFVISYFTGGQAQTLSVVIYSMTRKKVSPQINAVSTLLFLSVLALLAVINIRQIRQERAQSRKWVPATASGEAAEELSEYTE